MVGGNITECAEISQLIRYFAWLIVITPQLNNWSPASMGSGLYHAPQIYLA
jgi:hypothetical protein